MLRTGCQWKALDATGICSGSTAHLRFQEWVAAGVFLELWRVGLERYDELQGLDWSWLSMDGAMTKAPLGGGQGNRVLSEEDFAQIVLVPSGVEPLALNAYFQGAFVFQPVVPNLPQRGQVLRSMVLAHSALVFPKGHVQGPVQRVFDAPVASDGSQELFCWGWQAADVVAGLTCHPLQFDDGPPP